MRARLTTVLASSIAAIAAGALFMAHATARSPYDGSIGAHGSQFVRFDRPTMLMYSYNDYDRCWARQPDCGSWHPVCTYEGWRCDPPYRRDRYYDNRGYDDNRGYNRDYNRDYYDGDRCRPWVACGMPGFTCPSGTYCARYRNDYACFPSNCPYRRW